MKYYALTVLLLCLPKATASLLNAGGVETGSNSTRTVAIEFRNSADVAAVQMDVVFSANDYSVAVPTAGGLAEKFTVASNMVEAGRLRVVVGAYDNSPIKKGVLYRIPITVTGKKTNKFPLRIENPVLSSTDANLSPVAIAPSIQFSDFTSGASLNAKAGIFLTADVLAAAGSITEVKYYIGSKLLGSGKKAPFGVFWKPTKAGNYTLLAVALDSVGNSTTYAADIKVFFNSDPFAKPSTFAVTQNQKAKIPFATLLARASDPDKNKLIISEYDERSAVGGVLDTAGNSITYQPKKNYVGKDSFSFAVSDEVDGQAEAKVNLLVRRPFQTDFNGDKHPDLLLLAENGRNSVIFTLMNGALRKKAVGPKIPVGYKLAAVDDFDGDGKTDLFVAHPSNGKTQFILLNGAAIKGSKAGPDLPKGFEVAAADDFNADASPDLLLVNGKTRKTTFWYLNKLSRVSAKAGPVLLPGLSIAGTDDFNNDGSPDLCMVDSDGRKATIWYLKNRVLFEKSKKIKLPKGWSLSGVTDFSRNGKPDFILYDPKVRKTAIWRLNGLSLSVETKGPKIPSGYTIVAP